MSQNVVSVLPNSISTKKQVDSQQKRVVNGMEFVSVQSEKYRTYNYGERGRVSLAEPQWLFVRPSGAHLVIDKNEVTHYFPAGFIELLWDNKPDAERAQF